MHQQYFFALSFIQRISLCGNYVDLTGFNVEHDILPVSHFWKTQSDTNEKIGSPTCLELIANKFSTFCKTVAHIFLLVGTILHQNFLPMFVMLTHSRLQSCANLLPQINLLLQ